ncbi:MAG: DHH family phosphoesterase [Chitinispirillaceae bacterium]|jgi:phosphoesterase RecJ-like protein
MIWNNLSDLIKRYSTFLVSSHLSLDGDCVGSALAFFWYLTSLGKKVMIYNKDPVPAKFAFLQNAEVIRSGKPPEGVCEALVVLDCSNLRRLGWDTAGYAGLPSINIDHHRDNTLFATVNTVDKHASATGELIYRFFTDTHIAFPPGVAEALYAAIMTDTGGFRFPNTTSRILHICADLAEKGADPSKIYEKVYASHSATALLLQSRVWSTLRFVLDGKVCCMEMPLGLLDELGAPYSDSEGLADCTITAADAEVGILTKYTETETHFSLRSKGAVDVGRIAQKIPGGGGHSSAAGCTIRLPHAEALEQMLAIVKQELH